MASEVKDVMSSMKPVLSLSAKDLPALKSWKVGSKYQILLTVRQTELREGDEWDEDKALRGRFSILKAEPYSDKDE